LSSAALALFTNIVGNITCPICHPCQQLFSFSLLAMTATLVLVIGSISCPFPCYDSASLVLVASALAASHVLVVASSFFSLVVFVISGSSSPFPWQQQHFFLFSTTYFVLFIIGVGSISYLNSTLSEASLVLVTIGSCFVFCFVMYSGNIFSYFISSVSSISCPFLLW